MTEPRLRGRKVLQSVPGLLEAGLGGVVELQLVLEAVVVGGAAQRAGQGRARGPLALGTAYFIVILTPATYSFCSPLLFLL